MDYVIVDRLGPLYDLCKDPVKYGAFFTGSRVFGLNHSVSDYDYVIMDSDFLKATKNVDYYSSETNQDYDHKDNFKSVKFSFEGKIINLIRTLSDKEFKAWAFATNCFYALCQQEGFRSVVTNKEERVIVFERLKESRRIIYSRIVSK